jgi:hypothetical protein
MSIYNMMKYNSPLRVAIHNQFYNDLTDLTINFLNANDERLKSAYDIEAGKIKTILDYLHSFGPVSLEEN